MKNYLSINFPMMMLLSFCIFACNNEPFGEKSPNKPTDFILQSDTINMHFGETISIYDNITLSFDSVNEYRCPTGILCFWGGNAEIKFVERIKDEYDHTFVMNTHLGFFKSKNVGSINLKLHKLTPYPNVDRVIVDEDYVAKLVVTDISKLESNAKILSFVDHYYNCTGGWEIEYNNDTIYTGDDIVGEAVGREFRGQVDVYIQLGEKQENCNSDSNYYRIKEIYPIDQ